MTAPAKNKAIAAHLLAAFGAKPGSTWDVHAYRDDETKHAMDVLCCAGVPEKGIDSFATVTLSDHMLTDDEGEALGFGVELIGIGETGDDRVANILTTCGLNIVKDDWIITPDAIFPGVVAMYNEGGTMTHALFVDPLLGLWPHDIETLDHAEGKVAFLQMLPISDSEYHYAIDKGVDALLDALLAVELAPHDLNREPVM